MLKENEQRIVLGGPGANNAALLQGMRQGWQTEAKLAQELQHELGRRLGQLASKVTVTLENPAGPAWRLVIQNAASGCWLQRTVCDAKEFVVVFQRNGQPVSAGRCPSQEQILAAIANWLEHGDRARLYTEFAFVDRRARQIEQWWQEALACHPELQAVQTTRNPCWETDPTCTIRLAGEFTLASGPPMVFDHGPRSCRLDILCDPEMPTGIFAWHERFAFRYSMREPYLGAVLKRWLVDAAMPSAMRPEFPGIVFDPVADDLEAGNIWGAYFRESWTGTQSNLELMLPPELGKTPALVAIQDFTRRVVALISTFRKMGYCSHLRAYLCNQLMTVSRHIPEPGHDPLDYPHVRFEFIGNSLLVRAVDLFGRGDQREISCRTIALEGEVDRWLKELMSRPVMVAEADRQYHPASSSRRSQPQPGNDGRLSRRPGPRA